MTKVLFATSEVYPLIKTGGLADVTGAGLLTPFGLVLLGAITVVTTGRLLTVAGPSMSEGGTTRNTCPTSIRLAFSRLFQRAMSFQLWPVSKPIRIRVSPGLTE